LNNAPLSQVSKPHLGCRRAILIVVALSALAIFCGWLLIRYTCYSYDEVRVTVTDLPADADFVCILVNTPDGPRPMDTSVQDMLSPRRTVSSDQPPPNRTITNDRLHIERYRWVHAARTGILWRTTDGSWRIAWYGPTKVRLGNRDWYSRRSQWNVSLKDADELVNVSPKQVEAMGFKRVFEKHSAPDDAGEKKR
jgi:hypothetical protein